MTTFIFRKTMAISLLLRGNALARIVYDASGNPIETIFINWDKVTYALIKANYCTTCKVLQIHY
jgi:phage portal protein BeeE